ncbi:MAG: cation transporter [Thermoleophilia bacterium]
MLEARQVVATPSRTTPVAIMSFRNNGNRFTLSTESFIIVAIVFASKVDVNMIPVCRKCLREELLTVGTENQSGYLIIVGITFFALAVYILIEAGYNLARGDAAEVSPVGIALAVIALMVMPVLALLKTKVARDPGSRSLQAEAKETWFCAYLALVLLVGLVLNAALGWTWADPVAALAMLPLIVREGWEAISEAREDD